MQSWHDYPVVIIRDDDDSFIALMRAIYQSGAIPVPVVYEWDSSSCRFSDYSTLMQQVIKLPNIKLYPTEAIQQLIRIIKEVRGEYGVPPGIMGSGALSCEFLQKAEWELASYGEIWSDVSGLNYKKAAPILKKKGFQVFDLYQGKSEVVGVPLHLWSKPSGFGGLFELGSWGNDAAPSQKIKETRIWPHAVDVNECVRIYAHSHQNQLDFVLAGKDAIPTGTRWFKPFSEELVWDDAFELLALQVAKTLSIQGPFSMSCIRDERGSWVIYDFNLGFWNMLDFHRRLGFDVVERWLSCQITGSSSGKIQKPSSALIDIQPKHFNLTPVCQYRLKMGAERLAEDVVLWLTRQGGVQSFLYYDPTDPEPGREEVNSLVSHAVDVVSLERHITADLLA